MMSDEEEQYNPKAHKKLLQAIGNLGHVQHIRKSTRDEQQRQQDEFQLVKSSKAPLTLDSGDHAPKAVGLNDLVQILRTSSKHIDTGKKLKNVASTKKVLEKPLEKVVADRIKRTIGYEGVKKKLARWDAVVAKQRSAETQIFPIPSETIYINTAAHAAALKTRIQSDLAKELEASDLKLRALRKAQIGDTTDEKKLAQREDEQLQKKLTRDELFARRKELAYLKMRESQKSAKARQKNKIKSKKYHKLMKRQKMMEQLKEFELLQKSNPEAALEKLNELEKSRVLERASLRHKNTGTWAKNLQVRAKYDKDVRKDLAEQLAVSRQLTNQKQEEESDEEQATPKAQEEEEEDAFNPWTKAKTAAKAGEAAKPDKNDPNWRKYWTQRNEDEKLLSEHREEMAAATMEKKKVTKDKPKPLKKKLKKAKVVLENGWQVEEITQTIDEMFEDQEDKMRAKLGKKLQKLTKRAERLKEQTPAKKQKRREEKDELKNLNDLMFKKANQRADIDEELNYGEKEEEQKKPSGLEVEAINAEPAAVDSIDPNKVTTLNLTQNLRSSHVLNEVLGGEDDEADFGDDTADTAAAERQLTISQAFEDDDIVADFNKDKTKDAELKNTELQLSMPGWGSWAGAGISQEAINRRNKRLVLKLAEPEQRRDDNKANLYINETSSKQARGHMVSSIPFPFTSLADYEASIRAPIGRSFVPETAFRMLTRPAVITRKGQVIDPMDESELVKPSRHLRHIVDRRIQRMEDANTTKEQKMKKEKMKRKF